MPEGFRSKKDGAEQAAPVQKKYDYKICRGAWREGCGKLFIADSYVSVCPDCGTTLSLIRLSSQPEKPVARIILEKCEKCAYSLYAQKCLGDPKKPEICRQCGCLKCCMEWSGLANAIMKGEYSINDWLRERNRKREGGGPDGTDGTACRAGYWANVRDSQGR
jgi:hypothetical protein